MGGTAAPAASASTMMTAAKLFTVSYTTEPAAIPLNAFHAWTLTVLDAEGKGVADAEIVVSGEMPLHGHGLQAAPLVKNLGQGHYLVQGVKFFMPGEWVMEFTIKAGGKEDTVTFTVEI